MLTSSGVVRRPLSAEGAGAPAPKGCHASAVVCIDIGKNSFHVVGPGAANRTSEFDGLAGGVRSQDRTLLHPRFHDKQGIWWEFREIGPFPTDFRQLSR
jgi:hypothetical protein